VSRPTKTQLDSLEALWLMARQDHGGAIVAARFLLGLYNGARFPFDLTELRRLDSANFRHVLNVLVMDWQPAAEVHVLLGERLGRPRMGDQFELLAWTWNLKGKCSREEYKALQERQTAARAAASTPTAFRAAGAM